MNEFELRPHQIRAVTAIQDALNRNQKQMVVEMPDGCGKGLILAKTIDLLMGHHISKILIVTASLVQKDFLEHYLFSNLQNRIQDNKDCVTVENEQKILKYSNEIICEYQYIIFYDSRMKRVLQQILNCHECPIIVFSTNNEDHTHRFFTDNEVVFSYSYKEAVNDGVLTPAMDALALGPAIEAFSRKLLEQFGCTKFDDHLSEHDQEWDLHMRKGDQNIWVECKPYKSQAVSPTAANSLLKTIVMKKMKHNIPKEDIILLVLFSRIPILRKDDIYTKHGIIICDIENLVFCCQNNPSLLKQLSQIAYFPIDCIEGSRSAEMEAAGLTYQTTESEIVREAEKEATETSRLIQRLKTCESGQAHSGEYEDICEQILRTLFEANYFNILTSQHKTNDEHFRMDLIGALKTNQSNDESMHPLWKMFVQHYNSHFVVFEFKNYAKEIDQNLIYITEKYLFDAALRNVAIIISRKGFSESAKFAAEGCLKEHRKLILNITDDDLIKMLELKNDSAADYLLGKLEVFLMGISK